jgi:hypothetical protein
MIMQPLLLDIAEFLIEAGLCEGDGLDIFRDFIPEEPDSLVALLEYSGSPTLMVDPASHRSVQVTVRDKSADTARETALEIYKLFVDKRDETGKIHFTPNRWGQMYLRQTPFKYKTDGNGRVYYGFNLGVTTTID